MTDYTKDPRYGAKGWTLIYLADGGKPYFVKSNARKRCAPATNIRFADLAVGSILIHKSTSKGVRYEKPSPGPLTASNDDVREVLRVSTHYGFARCEHRWFDPVDGEHDRLAGEYAGIRRLTPNGPAPNLWKHSLRGLASNGYSYATEDQSATLLAAMDERAAIVAAFDAGLITRDEARLKVTPWAVLMRQLGLEGEVSESILAGRLPG